MRRTFIRVVSVLILLVSVLILLVSVTVGCRKWLPGSDEPTATSASRAAAPGTARTTPPDGSGGVGAFSADAGTLAHAGEFAVYAGSVQGASVMLGLELSGSEARALYVRPGAAAVLLQGKSALSGADTSLSLQARGAHGPEGMRIEATLGTGGKFKLGLLTSPGAKKPTAFELALVPRQVAETADGSLSETETEYEGAVSSRMFIRAKWTRRKDSSLDGTYHYTEKAAQRLVLKGSVTSSGVLDLVEKSPKGEVTGLWKGVLVGPNAVLARWSSPDGAKTHPIWLSERVGVAPNGANSASASDEAPPSGSGSSESEHCATVAELQKAELDKTPTEESRATFEPWSFPRDPSFCKGSGDEAWGVLLANPQCDGCRESSKKEGLTATAHLVHVASDGTSIRRDLKMPISSSASSNPSCTLRLVDYDGNGASEAVVSVWQETNPECCSEGARGIFALEDSRIVPYGPAARVLGEEGYEDFDGDGRPDIVFRNGYKLQTDSGQIEWGQPLFGRGNWTTTFSFLAHATPSGDFSATDEIAQRYARKKCASDLRSATSCQGLGIEIVCQRLEGVSEAKALEFLQKSFRPYAEGELKSEQEGESADSRSPCYFYADLERWAKKKPPFRIRKRE